MSELSRSDTNSRSLLANILDTEDDFILRNPKQPLPFAYKNGSNVVPHLYENSQPQEEQGTHIIPNMRNTISPGKTDNTYLTNHHVSSCPLAPVEHIHSTAEKDKKYNIKKNRTIEKELRNILKEIRVISDKIRDEVNFTQNSKYFLYSNRIS